MTNVDEEWLMSDDEVRAKLRQKSPHLPVDDMSFMERIEALQDPSPRPPCPHCGIRVLILLDPEDHEERPDPPDMTHRCAACGRQCRLEL